MLETCLLLYIRHKPGHASEAATAGERQAKSIALRNIEKRRPGDGVASDVGVHQRVGSAESGRTCRATGSGAVFPLKRKIGCVPGRRHVHGADVNRLSGDRRDDLLSSASSQKRHWRGLFCDAGAKAGIRDYVDGPGLVENIFQIVGSGAGAAGGVSQRDEWASTRSDVEKLRRCGRRRKKTVACQDDARVAEACGSDRRSAGPGGGVLKNNRTGRVPGRTLKCGAAIGVRRRRLEWQFVDGAQQHASGVGWRGRKTSAVTHGKSGAGGTSDHDLDVGHRTVCREHQAALGAARHANLEVGKAEDVSQIVYAVDLHSELRGAGSGGGEMRGLADVSEIRNKLRGCESLRGSSAAYSVGDGRIDRSLRNNGDLALRGLRRKQPEQREQCG